MDNSNELKLKQLVDILNDSLKTASKKDLIFLMQNIIELVELLKWDEKYNNTKPFIFVD